MKLNAAKNIMFGNRQVKKVYLGEHLIWPTGLPEPILPSGYEQVKAIEYRRAKGEEYEPMPAIDTRYLPCSKTKLVMDCIAYESPFAANGLFTPFGFCKNSGWNGTWKWLMSRQEETGVEGNPDLPFTSVTQFRLNLGFIRTSRDIYLNRRYKITSEKNYFLFDDGKEEIKVSFNDAQLVDYTWTDVSYGLCLFSMGNGTEGCNMRLYSCKIYEDDILVRNFIPAVEKKTGICGLYDTIESVFHSKYLYNNNDRTGDFHAVRGVDEYD